jgi:hypothetical protein
MYQTPCFHTNVPVGAQQEVSSLTIGISLSMKYLKEYVILWVDYLILLAFIFVCRPGDEVILDQSVYRTFSVSHQMVLSEYIMLIRYVKKIHFCFAGKGT